MLDSQEVDRQNAMQVAEAAERAGTMVSNEVEAIMAQAEAGAEEVRRNAEQDAEDIREQAAGSASRVADRIEALSDSLTEHVGELRREVDSLHSAVGERGET